MQLGTAYLFKVLLNKVTRAQTNKTNCLNGYLLDILGGETSLVQSNVSFLRGFQALLWYINSNDLWRVFFFCVCIRFCTRPHNVAVDFLKMNYLIYARWWKLGLYSRAYWCFNYSDKTEPLTVYACHCYNVTTSTWLKMFCKHK